jgi:hypothetical protein
MKNVVILGAGRTGSSVLAGLIYQAGYYINAEAIEPRARYPLGDYENPELQEMNRKIFLTVDYPYDVVQHDRYPSIEKIKAVQWDSDSVYKEFLEKNEMNRPWLWKDPRISFTIHFWAKGLDLEDTVFLHATRDPYEIFISHNKKAIKFTKESVYRTNREEIAAVRTFAEDYNIDMQEIDHKDLMEKPENVISLLNKRLETELSMEDFNKVFRRPKKFGAMEHGRLLLKYHIKKLMNLRTGSEFNV